MTHIHIYPKTNDRKLTASQAAKKWQLVTRLSEGYIITKNTEAPSEYAITSPRNAQILYRSLEEARKAWANPETRERIMKYYP